MKTHTYIFEIPHDLAEDLSYIHKNGTCGGIHYAYDKSTIINAALYHFLKSLQEGPTTLEEAVKMYHTRCIVVMD